MAISIQPYVILLDVMMPKMNGYDVCRAIRSTPTLQEIPILLITALDDRSSKLDGFNASADDFPCKTLVLRQIASRFLSIKE